MQEELEYPDRLTADEWETMKDEYQDEWASLVSLCLKKDGTPRKDAKTDDLARMAELKPWFSPEGGAGPGIADGDVYKHYVEKEFYVVTAQTADGVAYYTIKSFSYNDATAKPYHELREQSQFMALVNMEGIVQGGKWVKVDNVMDRW
jgi:hypothetical protein